MNSDRGYALGDHHNNEELLSGGANLGGTGGDYNFGNVNEGGNQTKMQRGISSEDLNDDAFTMNGGANNNDNNNDNTNTTNSN